MKTYNPPTEGQKEYYLKVLQHITGTEFITGRELIKGLFCEIALNSAERNANYTLKVANKPETEVKVD